MTDFRSARQAYAAYLLRQVPKVVEIGDYRSSVRPFLLDRQKCVTIDPEMAEPDGQWWIRGRFQDVDFTLGNTYGLLVMGLGLEVAGGREWRKLFRLINRSLVTVIETDGGHAQLGRMQKVKDRTNKRVVSKLEMMWDGLETTKSILYCLNHEDAALLEGLPPLGIEHR